MDTDSFIYDMRPKDSYKGMKDLIEHFDTSYYPKDSIYDFPQVNKKIIDKMKDENNGKIMEEFVGLK